MSEFHYVRTRGGDGGVDACEGPAIGLDLDTVLKDGLPPWNVALEIVAALCEILDIADEDGEVHGDVHPKYVFIDETGAVSLEGFGVKRKKGRAPEGTAKDTRTDLYGLGYTAFRLFCDHPLPDTVPTESSAHDEMVVDAALAVDLSGVPDAMQGDIQWYVAKLMEFDPAQRPRAVDCWRTFVAFANGTPGVDVTEWCAAALDGGGARRSGPAAAPKPSPSAPAAAPAPAPTKAAPSALPSSGKAAGEEEELPGLVVHKGPMATKVAFDEQPSAAPNKGATAFWSRDQIKKALELDPGDEAKAPAPGGGSATAFWTQAQLDAMQRGGEDAPRPRRAEGEGERRRTTANQRPGTRSIPPSAPPQRPSGTQFVPPPDASYHGPLDPPSGPTPSGPVKAPSTGPLAPGKPASTPPPQSVFVATTPRPADPPPAPAPAPPPGRTASPAAGAVKPAPEPVKPTAAPSARPPAPPEPEPEAGGGGGIGFVLFGGGLAAAMIIGGVVVLLALIVLILVIALPPKETTPPSLPPVPPAPIEAGANPGEEPQPPTPSPSSESPQPGAAEPKPAPGAAPTQPKPAQPQPQPAKPKPAPAAPSQPSPAPKPAPATQPKPTPAPAPAPAPRPKPTVSTDEARVTVKTSSSGSVSSCVPTKLEFSGQTSFTIESYLLPATCLITIDGAKGVFQVYKSGSVSCDKQGTAVLCDKTEIR